MTSGVKDLVRNISTLAVKEGYNRTHIRGVGVFKSSEPTGRIPLHYSQGIIFVVQGQKKVYLESQAYLYNPDNYLVLTLPLPAECETRASPEKPLLSLMVNLDLRLLGELARVYDEHQKLSSADTLADAKGLYVSERSPELSDAIGRLAACLQSPLHCDVLGRALVREIMFYVMSGPQAAPLYALVSSNTHLARVEKVLAHLHRHYPESLDVEQLAGMANMSPSTFHRNFRKITASSPKQYVKKLRLDRARELLQDKGLKVKQAAAEVGYESPTQFSREFKRYFGQSPQELGREPASIVAL